MFTEFFSSHFYRRQNRLAKYCKILQRKKGKRFKREAMLTFKVFFQLTFFYVAPEPEPSPISAPLSAQKYKQPCTLSISTSANKKN